MSKSIDIKFIEKEYDTLFPKCESLCKEIVKQLEHLIEKENIQLAVPLQYRTKTFASISEKLQQKRFNIKKSLLELQDLSGIRIITLFKRDSIKVAELVNSFFKIVNQYNTEERLDENEFGYSSIHIVCQVKKKWLHLPSFSQFENLKLEIQIRTLSQHSWAAASNFFQYKKEDNVPKPLKRSISRISALLETVDLEFERLLIDRANYRAEAKEQVNDKSKNLLLNVDLLEEILESKLPAKFKSTEDDCSILIDNLIVLGYTTVENLNTLIEKQLLAVLEENDRICRGLLKVYQEDEDVNLFENYGVGINRIKELQNGVFFTYMGLVRNMLTIDLGRDWNEIYKVKKKY
ncbi:MAG: hypothetical protein WBP45_10290 [Daejeonella sp.]